MKSKIKTEIHSFPAHWASYLINADSSGMEDMDIKQCDECTGDLGACINVSEQSNFGQFKGMGCDLAEYTFITIVTTVIFYKEEMPDNVLAVFPYKYDRGINQVACYSSIGQHSSTSFGYCNELKKATRKQYADLKAELERIGYNLKVI